MSATQLVSPLSNSGNANDSSDHVGSNSVATYETTSSFSDREPVIALTVNKVPRAGVADYTRTYCISCTTAEVDNCPFCLRSRLSKQHRMPVDRLAMLLQQSNPGIDARKISRQIARYARSDSYAAECNLKLLGSSHEAEFCGSHATQHDELARERTEWARRVKALEAKLASEWMRWRSEIERLRSVVTSLERELEEENLDDEDMESLIRSQKRKIALLTKKQADAVAELSGLQNDLSQAIAQKEAFAARIAELEAARAPCVERISELEAALEAHETKDVEEQGRMNRLSARNLDGAELKGALERQLETCQKGRADDAATIAQLETRVAELEALLATQGVAPPAVAPPAAPQRPRPPSKPPKGPRKPRPPGSLLKEVKRPPKVVITAKSTLSQIYEIFEKKLVADISDERAGNVKDSFPQFVKDYFTQVRGAGRDHH